ncbi:TPA: CBASS cGAMP-activated phospholipase [Serratia fonticola]
MLHRSPLSGCRVHISGSVSNSDNEESICRFVFQLVTAVLREGGSIVHGSHPSLIPVIEGAAKQYIDAGGHRSDILLVRSLAFSKTPEQLAEIERLRQHATVHIVPLKSEGSTTDVNEMLLSMREWIADTSDVIVCMGGKWWDVNKRRAGIPAELNCMLSLGKPAFLAAGLGGATQGYVSEHPEILSHLQNGLSEDSNKALVAEVNTLSLANGIVNQLKLLPRVRNTISRGRNFRILALDGGGLRGTFTASVLAKWDDMLGRGGNNNLASHFDLIAGTSTGAILAIGLAMGIPPAEILEFYRARGPAIFPQQGMVKQFLRSKHESSTLRQMLTDVFGDRNLADSARCRLVLPTVRAVRGESDIIVTPHSPYRTQYAHISAVDAALASSAAPTYFQEAGIEDDTKTALDYLDGGLWANNPILPAISEAVRYLGIPIDRIDVLNIGTISHEYDFSSSLGKGIAGWAMQFTDLFFSTQEHAAHQLARNLIGPTRMLRVNQQSSVEIKLDDASAIDEMAQRGNNLAADVFAEVRSRFLDGNFADDWRNSKTN